MVFKPFTHLARQSFAKSLTHGYAQSVVAASQSSYASSTTSFTPFGNHAASRFGRPGTSQLQNAFQNTPSSAGTGAKTGHGPAHGAGDGGLAAYYAAWQQQQHAGDENEWKQFQFAKRIGWKAPSIARERKAKGREEFGVQQESTSSNRGTVDRAYSASAADDIKKIQDDDIEAAAVAKVDDAIAREVELVKEAAGQTQEQSALDSSAEKIVITEPPAQGRGSPLVDPSRSPTLSANSSRHDFSPASDGTGASSLSDTQSLAFSDHLTELRDTQRYAEIPALFESMLVGGIRPTSRAYNALLTAAIQLPAAKHQVVPKALDVYSDMLRRKVVPDNSTYDTLIQLLATRAVDVLAMKRTLEEKRVRFGGMDEAGKFMFQSSEAEHDILADDNALSLAIKIFDASLSTHRHRTFSAEAYALLITACAKANCVPDMIRIYDHMESQKVIPLGSMFAPMIEAFGAIGDLSSAVECYNEYKALAISDDNGGHSVVERKDHEVYAAVIKAYAVCGKLAGGVRFFDKIFDSYQGIVENRLARLDAMQDTVVLTALVQNSIDNGLFREALDMANEKHLSVRARARAMAKVCVAAADNDDSETATEAFGHLASAEADKHAPATAMLALRVRQGKLEGAQKYWNYLLSSAQFDATFIEPTVMYAVALIGSGHTDEGLMEARNMFGRIRDSASARKLIEEIDEEIDEGIEFIGRFVHGKRVVLSPHASLSLLWTMIENGGLVSPIAENVLAGLGPEEIAQLSWKDLALALRVQANMLINGSGDIAHSARFAHIFSAVLACGMPLDKHTSHLVEQCLKQFDSSRPDLVQQWQLYTSNLAQQIHSPTRYDLRRQSIPALQESNFDPYASTTDYKGSTVISDELDRKNVRNGQNLNAALVRLRNIRRAGRHPRYITYAKLISAAAREGRQDLVRDVLGMARQDVPFLAQYSIVRYGWASILDAMVGASLVLGNRSSAAQFHQELLDLGAAPTANTFGLYITTLKDFSKTSDEATEAVQIFHRAKSEGVEPSSFLYNALIGKLGKARRIDDCLFYFAEMRSLGIRPTSVTYGTIVNALCRVSDEKFAEELFEEMETMPNYKPRPAPYNSLMQFFLTTKRDRAKVLSYYDLMKAKNIQPTMHTYKLLIDTYATLEPIDMAAAEALLETIRQAGQQPEAIHYASLIHAKGCVLHDMAEARKLFNEVLGSGTVRPQACLYQALFEAMVANHEVADTEEILQDMAAKRVELTPYIANTLIHGWAIEKNIDKSKAVYDELAVEKREPSTYEAMTRAFLAVVDRDGAANVVRELLSRGYPSAVSGKITDLLSRGSSHAESLSGTETCL